MPRRNITHSSAPGAIVDLARQLGANIQLARRRRRLRQSDLAKKAGISRLTLAKVEGGKLGTGLGAYLAALWALGLERGLRAIAGPEVDREGMTLEAARLGKRVRPSRRRLSDEF